MTMILFLLDSPDVAPPQSDLSFGPTLLEKICGGLKLKNFQLKCLLKCCTFNFWIQIDEKSCDFQKSMTIFQTALENFLDEKRGWPNFLKCSPGARLSNTHQIVMIGRLEMKIRSLAWLFSVFSENWAEIDPRRPRVYDHHRNLEVFQLQTATDFFLEE